MRRKARKVQECSHCGNTDDLEAYGGRQLCRTCVRCPHWDSRDRGTCVICFREYYTVHSFLGPMICDMVAYYRAARQNGVSATALLVWSYEDENFLDRWPQEFARETSNETVLVHLWPPRVPY